MQYRLFLGILFVTTNSFSAEFLSKNSDPHNDKVAVKIGNFNPDGSDKFIGASTAHLQLTYSVACFQLQSIESIPDIQLASALRFPDNYGNNLDALYDILTDERFGQTQLIWYDPRQVEIWKGMPLAKFTMSVIATLAEAAGENPRFMFVAALTQPEICTPPASSLLVKIQ